MDTVYQPSVRRRSKRIKLRGIDHHINTWGEDGQSLLVYLHGWGDTGSTFQFVADCLGRDWQVVAPDWRGFGRSAHAGTNYWFPDYLADLHALLEELSPDRPRAAHWP